MFYHKLGEIPKKRHIVFRNKETGGLYQEELFGTAGFAGTSSLLYHLYPPTMVKAYGDPVDVRPEIATETALKNYSFKGFDIKPMADYLESKVVTMINDDMQIGLAAPTQSMTDYFYKNSDADELVFIHKGSGKLKTAYGEIPFEYGDYIMIPRGTIYQMEFNDADNRIFFVESYAPIFPPKRYRNNEGQFLEHSPFCERDIKVPQNLVTHDEKGDFLIKMKKAGFIYPYTYANHPFDLVGWDGCSYPYATSIHDFEPLTGRIHMPPPIHQHFESANFVICSFVPRIYDYHPEAIPAPYHHSNIDSDELLYYVDGDFMSRNNIEIGQITLHPAGITHGPHPGAIERSIGKVKTEELAVMVDPFNPVKLTKAALDIEYKDYYASWIK